MYVSQEYTDVELADRIVTQNFAHSCLSMYRQSCELISYAIYNPAQQSTKFLFFHVPIVYNYI